jgi:hypothetical protein
VTGVLDRRGVMRIKDTEGWLGSTKGLIASVTGVLVVLAAFVNAGHDLFVSITGAPKTQREAERVELFKKHFRDSPVFTQPLEAKLEHWTVTVLVDVYNDGDVYLTVGPNSDWFPFSPVKQGAAISMAYAEPVGTPVGKYIQNQREDGGRIVRERIYQNGFRETIVIDRNTGRIVSRTTENKALSADERTRIEKGVPLRRSLELK